MVLGLDYSFAHPNLDCVKNSGYGFVARYIGDPDPNSAKYLDKPELNNILGRGISVVVVRETTAGFMFTDSGADHAGKSRSHCNQLGLWGIPIYYALDVDPRGLTQSERNRVHQFLADAAHHDGGGHNVGIYGSDDALDWFMGDNCHWGWQTYAWSSGRVTPKAHFRQYKNGQSICGGTVDLNETYRVDYGQYPRPNEEVDVTPEQDQMLKDIKAQLVSAHDGRLGDIWGELTATHGDVSDAEAHAKEAADQLVRASDGRLNGIWVKLLEMEERIVRIENATIPAGDAADTPDTPTDND